jgi:hypothetical protein
MYNACRHIKSSGDRCKTPALHGSHFCFFHDRLHTDALGAKFDALRLPVSEDLASILLALNRISAAIIDSRIDSKRAAQLIWIQQLALQVINRRTSDNEESIQSHSRSAHGEELAPPLALCEPGDDCDSCSHKAYCSRSVHFDTHRYEFDEDDGYEYENEGAGEPARCTGDDDGEEEVEEDDDDSASAEDGSGEADDDEDGDDEGDDDEDAGDSQTEGQLIAEVKRLKSVRQAYESGDVFPLIKLINESAP